MHMKFLSFFFVSFLFSLSRSLDNFGSFLPYEKKQMVFFMLFNSCRTLNSRLHAILYTILGHNIWNGQGENHERRRNLNEIILKSRIFFSLYIFFWILIHHSATNKTLNFLCTKLSIELLQFIEMILWNDLNNIDFSLSQKL